MRKPPKAGMFGPPKAFFGDDDSGYVWVSEFDEDSLESFYRNFTRLEDDPHTEVIPVIISSFGGCVTVLTAMRDMIKSSHKPVATIAVGKAMSAGTALLASGTKGLRFAGPSTLIMIHDISSGIEGRVADVIQKAISLEKMSEQMFQALSEDTGTPVQKFMKELQARQHADWYLTAYQAKDFGIIDHIEIPRLLTGGSASELVVTKAALPPQLATPKPARPRKR